MVNRAVSDVDGDDGTRSGGGGDVFVVIVAALDTHAAGSELRDGLLVRRGYRRGFRSRVLLEHGRRNLEIERFERFGGFPKFGNLAGIVWTKRKVLPITIGS